MAWLFFCGKEGGSIVQGVTGILYKAAIDLHGICLICDHSIRKKK